MSDKYLNITLDAGFFDSTYEDPRKYNANQMAHLLDGVITEGVFENKLNKFELTRAVTVGTYNDYIVIKSGKAWLNNKWIYNNTEIQITKDMLTFGNGIYYVYIYVNTSKSESIDNVNVSRKAGILVSNVGPTKPAENNKKFYCLGQFTYVNSTSNYNFSNVISYVGRGTEPTLPYVRINVQYTNTDHNEIVDARTGYEGITYNSLGEAIRAQVEWLNEYIETVETDKNEIYSYVFDDNVSAGTYFIDHSTGLYVKEPIEGGVPEAGLYMSKRVAPNGTPNTNKLSTSDWADSWKKTRLSSYIEALSLAEFIPGDGLKYYNSDDTNIIHPGDIIFVKNADILPTTKLSGLFLCRNEAANMGLLNTPQWHNYFEQISILTKLRYLYSNKLNSSDYSEIYTETLTEAMTPGVTKDIVLPGSYDNVMVVFYNNSGVQVNSVRLRVRYDSDDGQTNMGFIEDTNVTFYNNSNLYADIRSYGSFKIANSGRNGAQEYRYTNLDNPGKITTLHITCVSGSSYNPLPANTIIRIFGNNNI